MTENKDDQKEIKAESNSANNENQDNIRGAESVTLDEFGKQLKSEIIDELKKIPFTIGNLFTGETHIHRDVIGRDKVERAKRRSQKATNNATELLDNNQLPEDRILLLSVAVFNGASLQIITDAQKKLQELISKNDTEKKFKTEFFESPIRKRLLDIGASIKDGEEETQYGHVPTKIVELDDPSLSLIIVKHYWDEFKFDIFHETLIRWLGDSVENTPYQMRIRAANAVGVLAKGDFRSVEFDILSKWAASSNPTTRIAAAYALRIPALEDELSPQVLKLLHYWSTVNNWRLCWTATATYAGDVGLKFPLEALKDLKHIAETGDLRLAGVLTQSISNLFDEGETNKGIYEKILDSLVDWTEDSKKIHGTIGLFVFLNLARNSRVKADPKGGDWYTLLWLLKNRKKNPSVQIYSLWRRALNLKQSRAEALKILLEWVKSVDEDKRLYEPLEWLIKEIVSKGENREGDRLRYYLQKIANSPDTQGFTAENLLGSIW